MKKKWLLLALTFMLAFQSVACSSGKDTREEQETGEETTQPETSQEATTKKPIATVVPSVSPTVSPTKKPEVTVSPTLEPTKEPIKDNLVTNDEIDVDKINSISEIESVIERDIETTVNKIESEWIELKNKIVSYSEYKNNVGEVKNFYEKIETQTEQLLARMERYSVRYAEIIMDLNESTDDKYDVFEDLLDCIYEDATEEIYDRIYEGILDEMGEEIYEGVLEDAEDEVAYKEWRTTRSDEYSMWRETRSDVYKSYRNTRSNIYEFYRDMRSELWSDDIEKANKELSKYKEAVLKLDLGESMANSSNQGGEDAPKPIVGNDKTDLDKINSIEELEKKISEDVDGTIGALKSEWNSIKGDIDSYSKYKNKVKDVEGFYEKVLVQTEELCIRLQEYAVRYGEIIMTSTDSADDKYDNMDEVYDNIYDDARDEIYNEIYDGILDDMYETWVTLIIVIILIIPNGMIYCLRNMIVGQTQVRMYTNYGLIQARMYMVFGLICEASCGVMI